MLYIYQIQLEYPNVIWDNIVWHLISKLKIFNKVLDSYWRN
jgi:hypothetical protein